MKVEEDIKLDFKDVLIRPKRSTLNSRSEVSMSRTFKFSLPSGLMQWTGVPIVASNMDTVGNWDVARELKNFNALTAIHKYYDVEEWKNSLNDVANLSDNLIYTMGMGKDNIAEIDKAQQVISYYPYIKFICIDVANGYTEKFVKYVSTIRNLFPHQAIIAGNVVSREMTEALLLAGANIIKIGIGPGSVCTTRKVAGVGYPQLSCIMECADAAHGLNGYVLSDGGCTCPGDVAKAFSAGGDFDYLAYQTDNEYVISIKPLTAQEKLEKKKDFEYTGEKLSLDFQDIEVRAVLQIIADFTELNLVASDTVQGRITLRLQNVPWDQALEMVLKNKGLDKLRGAGKIS